MKKLILIALAVCAARLVSAAEVTVETATQAAEGFVASDAVGKAVLAGCTVESVVARGRLWIAHLAPSGHVILSGSDLVDPIVGFSKNDFVEPDPESPAFAVLEGADASVAAREAQGGGTRHERWTKLLRGGTSKKGLLKAADVENPDSVVIPPFLESHYNQWQPYNDYSPVHEPDENYFKGGYEPYRGRCPCGCVATAAAQGFRHFRWPARIDRVDSFSHDFTDANKITTTFPLRFDGHVPIDWNALDDDYVYRTSVCVTNYYSGGYSWRWEYSYDLRGTVPEATRYPIARLIMFADVLAHMSFGANASSANYGMVASNASDWYTLGTWVTATDSRVRSDIANGVPVQVTIPGHAVVGHGWATDGDNQYLYLNYGWGGDSNDGYYNINSSTIEKVYVGHYPRAKPQIDPLPKVCGTSLTLNWHFPDFYTNNLSGFTVVASKTATTTSTFRDDFSLSTGVSSSSEDICVATDSVGYDGNLLFTKPTAAGTYTFPDSYTLTSASVLTFRLYSFAALGAMYRIEARFNGGEWAPLCTPALKTDWGASGWSTERIYLGSHGGQTVQFRISNSHSGGWYPQDESRILLDDFTVTNVLAPVAPEVRDVDKTTRSLTLTGLEAGATYSFVVTPNISDALVPGESSESVLTSIAGTRNTPIPGEQTYNLSSLSFSASDTSGVWSYTYDNYGSVVEDTAVRGIFNCSITAKLQGMLTTTSSLSFQWCAENYQNTGVNTWTAVFVDESGSETQIGGDSVSADVPMQRVDLPLSGFVGQSGSIRISYSRDGGGWLNSRAVLSAPTITNVQVPSVPAVAWNTETLTALGTPDILSVSDVTEGFYRECGTNSTVFAVTCSNTVTSLEARPSHLSLVRDKDVAVTNRGGGQFDVTVTPSGIDETNFRSRLILTLAATDANGTTAYKDLSLRFEPVAVTASEVQVDITPADGGDSYSVSISYDWLEENGLVEPGSDVAVYKEVLTSDADADGDGLPNWAEYVCGTSPTNSNDKLSVTIRMENGQPVVETSLDDATVQGRGFAIVTKGTNNLSDWEVVTDTKTSTNHFFKVVIEPVNP